MYTLSENCPRKDACIREGKGLIHIKELTDKEGLYGHGRMFAHITVDPGCSIGYHDHQHETEVASWRPAMMFSSVDFPQPEGPTTQINSLL